MTTHSNKKTQFKGIFILILKNNVLRKLPIFLEPTLVLKNLFLFILWTLLSNIILKNFLVFSEPSWFITKKKFKLDFRIIDNLKVEGLNF